MPARFAGGEACHRMLHGHRQSLLRACTAQAHVCAMLLAMQISLMPESAEEKSLADYFPRLKLGGKKR